MNISNKKWKFVFFLLAGISIIVVLFLGYAVLDQSVTITYMSQGYEDTEEDLNRLATLFPKEPYSKKDIVYILRKTYPEALIIEDDCTVKLRGLRFEFNKEGKLISINTKAESSPEYECGNT